ncbi:hypothetical protein [Micromonospora okii]|uniref:hypothetical protein n=1 Tax=Micromonospora okii TaxID=1182970 RepID=UPI001E5CF1A3|nr:hypothetical protein [Micromonospora okii]
MLRYPGPTPSNTNRDAKYSVVHGKSGGREVRLIYRVSSSEKYLLTNDRHEKLVKMVDDVKNEVNGVPGGAFYINEYSHVLVPHPDGGCVYAGSYGDLLWFEFDGQRIGPVPPPGLAPGDHWVGPHVGILYVLCAGATDIRYEVASGQRILQHRLSDVVGQENARRLARRLAAVKGYQGGRVYMNEDRHFFAPVNGPQGLAYLYLGPLGNDPWFPVPDVLGPR